LAVLLFLLFLAQNCANILKKKNSKNLHFFTVAFDSSIYRKKLTYIAISALRFARFCDTVSKIDEAKTKTTVKNALKATLYKRAAMMYTNDMAKYF
jgi:hypothetical protein